MSEPQLNPIKNLHKHKLAKPTIQRYSYPNRPANKSEDMTDIRTEKRHFTRVEVDLPVDIQQGGSVWRQRLMNISLSSAATDQPDVWDALYNEPFTLVIHLDDNTELELHAYLQNVESKRLGFSVQHVDRSNIEPLRALLEGTMDPETLERELRALD